MSNVMEVADKTRDKTIASYMGYAATVAKTQGLHQKDMSIAFEGLIEAVDGYDPSYGVKLKKHIETRVQFAVMHYFVAKNGNRKLPERRVQFLATKLKMKNPYDIENFKNSLELSYNGTEQKVCNKDLFYKIMAYIKQLKHPKNAYEYINLYYLHGLTYREIGERYGVGKSRVSNVVYETLARARSHFGYWR